MAATTLEKLEEIDIQVKNSDEVCPDYVRTKRPWEWLALGPIPPSCLTVWDVDGK